jgi:ferredoxin-NADP reductase
VSRRDGRLTVDHIRRICSHPLNKMSVFLCGSPAMVRSLGTGLCEAGVAEHAIHFERFDFR